MKDFESTCKSLVEYYSWLYLRGLEEWDRWCKMWIEDKRT